MVIVPSDFDLYVRCSRAFKKICAAYTPVMESFSIDEVFLDMTGTSFCIRTRLRRRTKSRTGFTKLGFTVNIGISTNKLLVKWHLISKNQTKYTLCSQKKSPKNVAASGTRAVVPRKSIRKETDRGRNPHNRRLGACARSGYPDADRQENGHQLYQYARGIDDSPVKAQPDEAKGFSAETTFNEDIISIEQVNPILLAQCDIVAARMRRKRKNAPPFP